MIPHQTHTLPSESHCDEHAAEPRAWLEHIPTPRRSGVANCFHGAVRGGHRTPDAVVHQVQQTMQRRLQWTSAPTETAYLQAVLDALQTDRAGALAYAQSVIDYEHLPYETRQRLKAARTTPYLQEAMRGQPVSEKQVAYLRALGYTGPCPEDRAAASALIDRLKCEGGRP